jgi:hypothetical protein
LHCDDIGYLIATGKSLMEYLWLRFLPQIESAAPKDQ